LISRSYIFSFAFSCLFLSFIEAKSQEKNTDSLIISSVDSLTKQFSDNSKKQKQKKQSFDTIINYRANDRVRLKLKEKSMYLEGNSQMQYKSQKLEAEKIKINFAKSTLESEYGISPDGKKFGFPKFSESGTEYYGEAIKFNFKTSKGLIGMGETSLQNGFFFGDKIKRISQTELFIKDGCYTTCDAPHPHYYFGSSEMKMIAQDKVMLDPITFYVEDIPLFSLPFGLFFPTRGGRQSGLIVPTYAFTRQRGVVYENLGFYWAASDYFDSQITASLFTKGGYLLRNKSNWILKDKYQGSYDLEYGYIRENPEVGFNQNYRVRLNHTHNLTPSENLVVNLNFFSQNFNQNTSANLRDRITQNVTSNGSYAKSFDNGQSLALNYNREQNIINGGYTQNLTSAYTVPNFTLFSLFEKDFIVSYRGQTNVSFDKQYRVLQTLFRDGSVRNDTGFVFNQRNFISHSPQIAYNFPKLWHFNIQPSINMGWNTFFRRIANRSFDSLNNRVNDEYEHGVFQEYWYSYGLNLQTKIYGLANPKIFGLNAIRHTIEPIISWTVNPDFSGANYNFYSTYKDTRRNQDVRFSRYSSEGGSRAPEFGGQNIGISVRNRIETKIAQSDTLEDKLIEVLQFDLNTNYRPTLDSFRLSPINISFRSPALTIINFNGGATLNAYDDQLIIDTARGVRFYRDDKNFMLSNGTGLARLTDINFGISTGFSGKGIGTQPNIQNNETKKKDSVGLGERFQIRQNAEYKEDDIFAEELSGYTPSALDWNLNLGLQFAYREPQRDLISRSINFNATFNFNLTPTWKIETSAAYDLVLKQLLNTSVNITKDMHCWDFNFRWYPTGFNRGFFFRFGIKASQLRDLRYERREDAIFR
jgi:hypothetical protein